MKKKEENPVDENLGKIIEFLLSLPAVNVDNLKIEEVKDRHLCNTTVPELYIKWVVLGDKDAFLFRLPYDIKEKNRIYYPTKVENALKDYEEKLEDIPEEVRDEFEKAISLRVIDNYWMEHISTMSHLRDGIGLRGYANTSPLQAYTMEGYQLFDEMIAKINRDISIYLLKSEIRQNIERKQVAKNAITNDSKDHAKVQKKSTKVGRNDPCPCGSGKKYKQCCGK